MKLKPKRREPTTESTTANTRRSTARSPSARSVVRWWHTTTKPATRSLPTTPPDSSRHSLTSKQMKRWSKFFSQQFFKPKTEKFKANFGLKTNPIYIKPYQ